MDEHRDLFQTIWGIALLLMGVGIFFRVPYVMDQIAEIKHYASAMVFIRICFYFMGVLLIGGGIKKLYAIWGPSSPVNDSGDK